MSPAQSLPTTTRAITLPPCAPGAETACYLFARLRVAATFVFGIRTNFGAGWGSGTACLWNITQTLLLPTATRLRACIPSTPIADNARFLTSIPSTVNILRERATTQRHQAWMLHSPLCRSPWQINRRATMAQGSADTRSVVTLLNTHVLVRVSVDTVLWARNVVVTVRKFLEFETRRARNIINCCCCRQYSTLWCLCRHCYRDRHLWLHALFAFACRAVAVLPAHDATAGTPCNIHP